MSEIFAKADQLGLSAMELVEQIHDSKVPDVKPAVKRKLSSFVNAIRKLRDQAKNVGARISIAYISSLTSSQEVMPSSLIRSLLNLVGYEEHLRKTHPDWDVRWENVRELITFASDVQGTMLSDVDLAANDNDDNK